jgi:hypothetical protein
MSFSGYDKYDDHGDKIAAMKVAHNSRFVTATTTADALGDDSRHVRLRRLASARCC